MKPSPEHVRTVWKSGQPPVIYGRGAKCSSNLPDVRLSVSGWLLPFQWLQCTSDSVGQAYWTPRWETHHSFRRRACSKASVPAKQKAGHLSRPKLQRGIWESGLSGSSGISKSSCWRDGLDWMEMEGGGLLLGLSGCGDANNLWSRWFGDVPLRAGLLSSRRMEPLWMLGWCGMTKSRMCDWRYLPLLLFALSRKASRSTLLWAHLAPWHPPFARRSLSLCFHFRTFLERNFPVAVHLAQQSSSGAQVHQHRSSTRACQVLDPSSFLCPFLLVTRRKLGRKGLAP